MSTNELNLNVIEALKSALPFSLEFIKKYWLLTVLYVVNAAMLHIFLSNNRELADLIASMSSVQFVLLVLLELLFVLLLAYCVIKMALPKLAPTLPVANKSTSKILLQLFCLSLIMALLSGPLIMLFILPAIWWFTKSSVAMTDIVSTDDGPVQSIVTSHKLMNNKFWISLGYLFGTGALVSIGFAILVGLLGLVLGIFILMLQNLIPVLIVTIVAGVVNALAALIVKVIIYFCQVRLYVYLKSNQ